MDAIITLAAVAIITSTIMMLFVVEPFVELAWELVVTLADTIWHKLT